MWTRCTSIASQPGWKSHFRPPICPGTSARCTCGIRMGMCSGSGGDSRPRSRTGCRAGSMSLIVIYQHLCSVLQRSKVDPPLERVNLVNLLMRVTLGDVHLHFVCTPRGEAPFRCSLEIVQMPNHIKAGKNEHPLLQSHAVRPQCSSSSFLPQKMNSIVTLSNTTQFSPQLAPFYDGWNIAGNCKQEAQQ